MTTVPVITVACCATTQVPITIILQNTTDRTINSRIHRSFISMDRPNAQSPAALAQRCKVELHVADDPIRTCLLCLWLFGMGRRFRMC
ncbi:MAG: hypothetical protein IPF64_15325 [Flavobacteriales bacterium]|nr:hypothetical protein [Flavobacteriales bacterium]